MDKLIPIFILIGITLVGFVAAIISLVDVKKRHDFTTEYRNKFIEYVNELLSKRSFNQELYYELTSKVKEMQYELGADGVYAYVQDNLKGYSTRNYQLLINLLPETRSILSDYESSLLMSRYNQEIQQCDDMFVRHIGTLESLEKAIRKKLFNPFINFAEGVRTILSIPVQLLKWFGLISEDNTKK